MGLRGIGILLLVAALLAAFVYFYEIRGRPAREQASQAEGRIFAGLEANEVDELTITRPDVPGVRAARRERGWQILEPVDFPGAPGVLDAIARSLAEMASEGRLESPAAEAVYGLDGGAGSVRFSAAGVAYSLRIGNPTPVGPNVYVAVRGPGETPTAIHLLANWRVRDFDSTLDELRDGRVLVFDASQVDRIVLRWRAAPRVALERAASGWHIVEPAELDADVRAVDELLATLGRVTATGYLDAPPGDAETGLDRPEHEVSLRIRGAEGPRELQLAVGALLSAGPAEPARRYVRGSQSSLYLVPDARIAPLPRSLFELRFKQLAQFSRDAARAIELVFRTASGRSEELLLERDADGQAWSLPTGPAAMPRVEELVGALASLAAIGVAAESLGETEREALGLDPARVEIRVRGESTGDGTSPVLADLGLGELELGRGGLLVRTAGRSEIYRLDASFADLLPLTADSFRVRFLASDSADSPDLLDASDEPGESVDADASL